jgi:hypothetical protein
MKPILIFNRVESEYKYPYTKYYNLIKINVEYDVCVDGECYSYFLRNVQIDDINEIKIHSSEEANHDYSKIFENINEGLYLCKNGKYLLSYNCEKKEFNEFSDGLVNKIDDMIKKLLIEKYTKNYN